MQIQNSWDKTPKLPRQIPKLLAGTFVPVIIQLKYALFIYLYVFNLCYFAQLAK